MEGMKKVLVLVAAGAVLIAAGAWGLFEVSKSRTFQFFGGLTARVETGQKAVALTFDDAPGGSSAAVLKILNDKSVKATFYAMGQSLKEHPQEGKAIAASGSEIGNHSYSHPRFVLKPLPFIAREIETTSTLIRDTGYRGEITFRPPNGKKLLILPWYLRQHNMKTVMWDVEPDTYGKSADFIVDYTLKNTRPGSIILIHPFCAWCQADRDALPRIIDGLRAKGYRFVTVSELMKMGK